MDPAEWTAYLAIKAECTFLADASALIVCSYSQRQLTGGPAELGLVALKIPQIFVYAHTFSTG